MGNFNPDVEAPGFEMPSWAGPSSKLVNWAIPQQPLPKRTASACGRRERRVFRHQPRKKHTHKIKDPSSGWSWKKSSNMFSSNLYYQWPWKVMHLSMWQWSPWRKTGKRLYGPSVWDLGEPFSSRDRLCELHSMTWRFGQWVCNG